MNTESKDGGKEAKELADLSDMIRRHAEELAQISGRLAETQPPPSTPPPATPPPASPAGEGADSAKRAGKPPVQTHPMWAMKAHRPADLPVLAGDLSLSGDNLPVLNAFREFLEYERRRTRNRLLVLGGSIFAGMLIVLALAAWYGRDYLRRARADLSSAQDATEIKVAHYATAASNLESRLALERRSLMAVANTASNLQSALSGQKQTVSQVKEEMTSRIRGQAGEIDQLRETITALEIENAMLQSNLKDYLGRTTIKEEEEDFSPPPLEPAAPQPATNIAVPAPAIPFRLPVP